jgi:4-amino-4-deoxy-L-arabinose transferase-like glycosyltransferase
LSSNLRVYHGAGFYWILAPGAFLTDAHPVAAVLTLAFIGIAGVAAAWWLGRTVGGPLAGHLTALLMAVSPSAISASTFIWNANIVAPGAALASAAAWHAWRTRQARWWSLSAVGGLVMLNGHLLAAIAVPPFVALLVADVLRRGRSDWPRMLAPILVPAPKAVRRRWRSWQADQADVSAAYLMRRSVSLMPRFT